LSSGLGSSLLLLLLLYEFALHVLLQLDYSATALLNLALEISLKLVHTFDLLGDILDTFLYVSL
jgi:hypothetical protein